MGDQVATIERPLSAFNADLSRAPTGVTGQTCPLESIGVTPLTTSTTTIFMSSIVLPMNLQINNLGIIVTTAGTATGTWLALVDAGMRVRAVTANSAGAATGFFNPAVTAAFVTTYAGLWYVAYGTVSSVAPQVAAGPVAPTAATFQGPPVLAGTNATAASTTPPTVGTVLGALTGTATANFYGQTS
jgi:hypothetical protein